MINKLKEFYKAGEKQTAERDLRLQRSAAKNQPKPRKLKISSVADGPDMVALVMLCLITTILSVFTLFMVLKMRSDYRELNRLQGIFNEKTIEFFKLINENEKEINQ